MNEAVTSKPKFLLEDPCRPYLKEMISAFERICTSLFEHLPFLVYWTACIKEKIEAFTPEAEDTFAPHALRFAFKYYNSEDNANIPKSEEAIAQNYIKTLISFYNCDFPDHNSGRHIAKFIKGFYTGETRTTIKTDAFEWYPQAICNLKDSNIARIAREFDFVWKFTRLWQFLGSSQEYLIFNFMGLKNIEDIKNPSLRERIPSETIKRLSNTDLEPIAFFKDNLKYYSPEYMTFQEMVNFLKKACLRSIKDDAGKNLSPSNANIKPLDSIWLLGRFYRLHGYSLDFINQVMPPRAIKQFSSITESPFLTWTPQNLDAMVKRQSIKVGDRTFPLEDVLLTAYNHRELLAYLKHKSNEILPGKERNPFMRILLSIKEKVSSFPFLSGFDYTNDNTRFLLKNYPSTFKALIVLGSVPDFAFEHEKSLQKIQDVLTDLPDNKFLSMFFGKAILSRGLESDKNLFFITAKDFDEYDLIGAFFIIILCHLGTQNNAIEQDNKPNTNQT